MREMKDSGIEWIGAIPAAWGVHRIASHFQEIKEKNTANAYSNALQFKMGKIIAKPQKWDEDETNETYSAYTVVHPNTIMINGLNLEFDFVTQRVARVECNGIITSAYIALSPRNDINAEYICYLLKSYDACRAFHSMGRGLRKILSYSELKNKPIVVPPLAKQEHIAAFLDAECAEIDAVLEKTRASIEEYKKLKQAVITQAVTKGIRGDRPMKDSGIEWIGEIPAGVPISRVGLHFDIVLGKMLCSAPVDDNYTLESYYCAADVHFEGLSNGEKKKMWFSPDEKEQYCVKSGDLLVVEGGAGAGGCAIAASTDVPIYIQNSIMIVRSKGISNIRYLRYLLECLVKKGYIDVVCNKATIPHFTKDKLANVPFIVFSQSEQEEIAEYLNEKCAGIDALIAKKQQYLTEIETYKKSLIYEYVTGKKEVHPL
uniref:restriction endonuclease subunit S n=1 Tax=Ruminococcus bromii TaxID=40518 RepID=UPI00402973F8